MVRNFVSKIAGILYVFHDFCKQKLWQKSRHSAKRVFSGALYFFRFVWIRTITTLVTAPTPMTVNTSHR